ncbi:MAG: outer membrane beta-barrel protein [Rhodothermia bacterium]|nr:outer membrane beta-barrel protein [Rhodothermia bacterium]
MKKVILLLALTFAPFTLFAQGKVYLGGGLSLNQAPNSFKDQYKNGFNFEAAYGYPITENVEILAKGQLHSFNPDAAGFDTAVLSAKVEGGVFSDVNVGAGLKLNFGAGNIKPYVFATGGFHSLETTEMKLTLSSLTTIPKKTENTFGVNAGVGIEVGFGGAAALFVEPSYTMLFNDAKTKFIPIKVGLAYSLMKR